MTPAFPLRPGTDDAEIFRTVVVENEYRLAERLEPEDIVLDVGTHAGSFSHLAASRGSHHVIGYEAEPANHARALANLAPWGHRVRIHRAAVWRSDRQASELHFTSSTDPCSTGGGNVFFADSGPTVPAVSLDAILAGLTRRHGRRVRFLKLDVETAEFPILLTSRRLRSVDEIAGEFHEVGGGHDSYAIPEWARVPGVDAFTIDALERHLRSWGFGTWHSRMPGQNLGLFYASRMPFKRWMRWQLEDLRDRLGAG